MEKKELEKIEGEVDSVIHRNEDNGFCVIMLNTGGELISVVGDLGNVEEGEELVCRGSFVVNQKYGDQFKCELCERSLPTSAAAIQRYLASGAIKGIGPVTARSLVKRFGDDTLNVLENEPERLCEIDGITTAKAEKISKAFKKTFAVRMLMIFLSGFNIPMSAGIAAFKKWGETAEKLIRSNPYVLCSTNVDVPFVKADQIAASLEIPRDSDARVRAGISCVLKANADAGHTCLPIDKLSETTCSFLKIDAELFNRVLADELVDETLFCYIKRGKKYIMLYDYYKAEDYISKRLSVMKECSYDSKMDFSAVIDLNEKKNGIEYEDKQREAINLSLSYGFLVITGGPGTGKTTTLNAIIDLYKQQGMNVMIAAPTGRAAKRLTDLTGYEAKTIHRLLEVKPTADGYMKFVHDDNNMLDCDALIIDEMSMVDTLLFEAVLRGISLTCKLVLVGDSDQLPSVGAGNVLKDIMESNVMPVVRLTQIFRQAQMSAIVTNAHKIVNGEHIDLTTKDNDFFFMQRMDYESLQQLTSDLCKTRLPKAYKLSPFEDIQVLSPTKKGPAGTVELNKRLQQELNPPQAGKSELKTAEFTYRTGDKVMQTKNDYDIVWKRRVGTKSESGAGIFNGDIGRITACNKILKTLTIDFEGREAVYNLEMLKNLELAYAVTVHKSQGSEFDAVILTVFGGYDKLYYRNLLYTAVTRAKKLLIIVGDNRRVDFMIDNDRRMLRYTCLKDLLKELDSNEKTEASLF